MSYSYLKNVFPNYDDSTKSNTNNLYNTFKSINLDNSESQLPVPITLEKETSNNIVLPQTQLLESFKQDNQDNLKFYNLPYLQKENKIEGFEESKTNENCNLDCDLYIKHINECNKCKSTVLKQFGIESDRIKNEEIMEVVSYLIFGLFILLLIDSIKNSKN